ncbi:F-type H+-transporting ATPase subunit epsilon [Candidatus Kinetoplastibacterium desouzaii TCC079E]|uniref:ATP synthase epsilon chain n=1 Tax=Candidatus Kinetoplastidibacterium desouzai TCC079E TaxID=1208919 RepID=M1LLI4_9PROT|nr:F0F1 ATP synthase subunit epsilon [Candidatus Kinetoplastibacterium desouzaii]AGF46617.1 F-type H+-transporting ATPase subunit epsilon [Candidatus Kinetoplastibacterium desouzaii TCC079E]
MTRVMQVDIVSAVESIYSGKAKFVQLPADSGEIGILPGHTPLISRVCPGALRIVDLEGQEHNIFVAGGILEVQPNAVTVLTDTAIRASNLDEMRAVEAKRKVEETLRDNKHTVDILTVEAELNMLAVQARVARRFEKNKSYK